jgi:hypothetical protein
MYFAIVLVAFRYELEAGGGRAGTGGNFYAGRADDQTQRNAGERDTVRGERGDQRKLEALRTSKSVEVSADDAPQYVRPKVAALRMYPPAG